MIDKYTGIVIDTKEFPMDHAQFCKWHNRHGGKTYGFDATDAIEADHAAALMIEARRYAPSTGTSINFPKTVGEPTPCKTRTFKVVLPRDKRYNPHGTLVIVKTFPNRPVVIVPRIGLPGFYSKWADAK